MNILLLIEGSYPWFRGGASEWIYQYLKHFKHAKFHIIQVSTASTKDMSFDAALYPLTENIVTFKRIPPPHLTQDGMPDLSRWYKNVNLTELNMDRIHVVNAGFAGWLGSKLSERFNIPMILTEHTLHWKEIASGAPVLDSGYTLPLNILRDSWVQFFKAISRAVYAQSSVVISVAQSSVIEQKLLGAFEPMYIPNGISSNRLLRTEKKRSKPPVIGWVGRCSDIKHPLRFLDLVECFKVNEVDARFVMVICDANEPKLEHSVKERLKSLHRVEVHWNKPADLFYDKMDAICVTSKLESQPLVLLEAAARKVVPFGWRSGDFNDTFGMVVDQQDIPDALIQHWVKFWRNETGFVQKQVELFDSIQANHTWESIFAKYEEILAEAGKSLISYAAKAEISS